MQMVGLAQETETAPEPIGWPAVGTGPVQLVKWGHHRTPLPIRCPERGRGGWRSATAQIRRQSTRGGTWQWMLSAGRSISWLSPPHNRPESARRLSVVGSRMPGALHITLPAGCSDVVYDATVSVIRNGVRSTERTHWRTLVTGAFGSVKSGGPATRRCPRSLITGAAQQAVLSTGPARRWSGECWYHRPPARWWRWTRASPRDRRGSSPSGRSARCPR